MIFCTQDSALGQLTVIAQTTAQCQIRENQECALCCLPLLAKQLEMNAAMLARQMMPTLRIDTEDILL